MMWVLIILWSTECGQQQMPISIEFNGKEECKYAAQQIDKNCREVYCVPKGYLK